MSGAVPPSPSPRITALRIQGDGRVLVELDGDRTLEVPLEVMTDEHLSVGDPVDAQLEARLVEAEVRARLRAAAFSLLSVRARSRRELADRLKRKEFPIRLIERCLDEFEDAGWIDDPSFARSVVRDRLRLRPRGPGRMTQELRTKGVSEAVAREAVDTVFEEEEVSIEALALEVAQGWFRRQGAGVRAALRSDAFSPERDKARRRFHAFLARRGFTGSAARDALETLRREPDRG